MANKAIECAGPKGHLHYQALTQLGGSMNTKLKWRINTKAAPVEALREFRNECKEQRLGVECALATLAIHAYYLSVAYEQLPLPSVLAHIGNLRKEMRNLQGALKKEYPELHKRIETSSHAGETMLPVNPAPPRVVNAQLAKNFMGMVIEGESNQ